MTNKRNPKFGTMYKSKEEAENVAKSMAQTIAVKRVDFEMLDFGCHLKAWEKILYHMDRAQIIATMIAAGEYDAPASDPAEDRCERPNIVRTETEVSEREREPAVDWANVARPS